MDNRLTRIGDFNPIAENFNSWKAFLREILVNNTLCKVQYYVKFFKSCIKALLIINKLS